MKICEYGCGREGKFYFPTVGKWCCSKNHNQCPERRKRISQQNMGKNNPMYGKNFKHSKKSKKKIGQASKGNNAAKLTIRLIKEKYSFFSQIEEIRYNPDRPKEKEIQVHCKNHNCPNSKEKGGWFIPTYNQICERRRALENLNGSDGAYFYCSQECKDICPLYSLRSDPLKNTKLPYIPAEHKIWRQTVLELDDYICQYCGELATHAHHEKPVKTHPHLALDPDNGVSCCEKCHYKYGHKTGTECSTGSLANKIQQGCNLGD